MPTPTTATGTIDPEVRRLAPVLVATRRDIHQHPEVGLREVRTTAALPIEVQLLVRTAERYLSDGHEGGPDGRAVAGRA